MNYVREYWERISSGEIVTSRRVKAVYGRLVAEMDAADESSPYYFDEAVGERPIIFVERFCKQSQGTLGESLTLELFQKAFIQLLFGWLERATGYLGACVFDSKPVAGFGAFVHLAKAAA